MNSFIEIISTTPVKDAEGFAVRAGNPGGGDNVLASIRADTEDRHGSVAWKNRAAFSTATALFRFRVIPGVVITTAMIIICGGERYKILSIEDVKGRGMYIEALAERVVPSG
jgi:hypothetical protein